MQLRADGPDVWYAAEAGTFVGPGEITFLKERAAASPRLRARICLHENVAAPVHEMVIVHHRSCYVRPHRHPRKPESLTVLEGEAVALFFDDAAAIASARRIAAGAATICRVPVNAWHGLVIESEWLVFYEVSAGPFVPGSSEFAPWAPAENDAAAAAFLAGLRRDAGRLTSAG